MKKLIVGTLLIILITLTILPGCSHAFVGNVPETPFSAEYIVKQWRGEQLTLVATTDVSPQNNDSSVLITNYWILRYTEEGNPEWIRRDENYYYLIIPIGDGVITVRQIKDEEVNEIIHIYKGEKE